MSKSRFFMGLGIGLICGAILLQLMIAARDLGDMTQVRDAEPTSWSEAELGTVTEDQWLSMADRLGYQPISKDVKVYKQEQLDEAVRTAREQERQAIAEKEPVAGGEGGYSISIMRGMTSDDVADLLLSLGLIESKGSFTGLLDERNLHSSIQVGNFTFEGKPDLEEIVAAITK